MILYLSKVKGIHFKRLRNSALPHKEWPVRSEFLSEDVLDRWVVNYWGKRS